MVEYLEQAREHYGLVTLDDVMSARVQRDLANSRVLSARTSSCRGTRPTGQDPSICLWAPPFQIQGGVIEPCCLKSLGLWMS